MAESLSTPGVDGDRDRQTGAPADQTGNTDEKRKEKPTPASLGAPSPTHQVQSPAYVYPQTPAPGETPNVIPLTALSTYPALVDCPYCRTRSTTRTDFTAGPRATCWSCLCCLCIGPFAALLPCILPNCKDCAHYCGKCNRLLAVVERTGGVRIVAY